MEGARFALTALQGFWESQRDSSETYSVKGMDVTRCLAHIVTTVQIEIRGKRLKSRFYILHHVWSHLAVTNMIGHLAGKRLVWYACVGFDQLPVVGLGEFRCGPRIQCIRPDVKSYTNVLKIPWSLRFQQRTSVMPLIQQGHQRQGNGGVQRRPFSLRWNTSKRLDLELVQHRNV